MFLTELNPIVQELAQQPLAFFGGFFSGIFRLSLEDEPVNSWLQKQGVTQVSSSHNSSGNGKNTGPQSIDIE
ncbi:hypothetical protein [Merismopedia glauca]|uniref:Uncharacterized protein n=1 Tax=Merismopedia glauca CCAP 1448/3 TaxID=1296344 RepID=A0A2T1C6M1_9CYAN|nr:hypothetical protein [Merismopedia glauca]PSB03808.1 hypothetical protein C7B64_06770 [Merismopedia glauca CCAP 1448/3]